MSALLRADPVADAGATWARVRADLRQRVGDHNFEAWIAPLRVRWMPGAVRVEAPDRIACQRVARHFTAAIDEALRAAGIEGTLSIEVAAPPPRLPIRLEPPPPGHTFARFVTGLSNDSAHGAARDLVGRHRSPLFVHGPSGVGKTHLLHAVWHELDARGVLVACLPAAELVAALVTAYGAGGHAAFWQDLSPVRALLLDDVHSLAGHPEVQERLMDGLAGWMADGRLLALTSDRPPDDIPRLTDAVRRHCASGVIATIARPEPALRVAILEHKAEAWGLTLDHDLAARIGGAIGGNVRRLEGALTRLVAHARLAGRRIDEALALEILPELRAAAVPTVKTILEATAAVFGVRARPLLGRSRRPELVLPRQVAMYLARRLLQRPFAELAAEFARDHTTVMQAWRQMNQRLGVDRALGRLVAEVEQRLGTEHLPDEGRKNVEAR